MTVEEFIEMLEGECIKRSFVIIDENNNGKILFNCFKKYLSDYRYNIT